MLKIRALCKFEIKTERKSVHEKFLGHQYHRQQHERNEEQEKSAVTFMYIHIDSDNEVRHLMCFGSKILLMKAVGLRTCLDNLVWSTLKTKRNMKKRKNISNL